MSFYAGGERIARVSGRGYDLASATENAARALAAHPKLNGKRLRGGRLVVDRVVGSALIPLTSVPVIGPLILSLSVDPGRDGIRGTAQGATRTLLASDLVEGERFAVAPIIPGIPELRFGLDARFIEQRIGDLKRTRIERLRAEQWVERDEPQNPEEAEALAQRRAALVERGEPLPARTTLTRRAYWGGGDLDQPLRDLERGEHRARELLLSRRARYREAAHLAGAYLTRHQNEDGRFDYQYFPYRDEVKQPSDARYSIPRHSGAIYGLSMLYRDQPKPEYEQTARRAVDWLVQYVEPECGGWTPEVSCIPKISSRGQETRLGDNALTALALLKYLEVIEDSRAERIARGLLHFLSRVQRADGDFHHKYLLYDDSVVPEERGMFASEQAAFAFVLAAKRWPDGPWRARAQRALDALTVHKYGHDFLSSFFYGADHWTCLAANAAYPILKRREYLDFCLGYARFLQRLQYRYDLNEGDLSYHGHYGFGFLSPPQAPATGGFTEGVMGSLLLAESHGVSPESLSDIYAQVSASVEALTHDQVKRAGGWAMKRLDRAEGAFRRSLVESEVRVDFVQHSLSALLMTQQLQTAQSSRATLP